LKGGYNGWIRAVSLFLPSLGLFVFYVYLGRGLKRFGVAGLAKINPFYGALFCVSFLADALARVVEYVEGLKCTSR